MVGMKTAPSPSTGMQNQLLFIIMYALYIIYIHCSNKCYIYPCIYIQENSSLFSYTQTLWTVSSQ